jgi:hypothetical protein
MEVLYFADQYLGNFPFSRLLETQLSEKSNNWVNC